MTKEAPLTNFKPIASALYHLIQRQATATPDHPYLEDARSNRIITYAKLLEVVNQWIAIFEQLATPPGAAILIDNADPLNFSLAFLATIASGHKAIPVDPDSPDSEPQRLSDLMGGAQLIISDRSRQIYPPIPIITLSPSEFLPTTLPDSSTVAPATTSLAIGTVVLFTSGSTGTPKGVELPEPQLLYVAQAIATHNHLQPTDRGFNSLPLFHVNAEVVGVLATLVAGATLVLDKRFHRQGFWELLADRHITWLNAVPAILALLSRSDSINPPHSLRFIRSASAPLPDAVQQAFGNVEIVVSYGMTEGASQITATPLGQDHRPGSVGVPIGNQLEIRNEQGHALPAGEIGVVWVRGQGIIHSYMFGRASDRFDANGWLSTGDVGKVDTDGYVYLLGRVDDVINRGGEKLYPAEIEDVLLQDIRVREAVVAARSHEILGQVPVAYVIPAFSLSTQEAAELQDKLVKLCEQSLSRFKRPVELVVVEDLPRAATGKIQRVKVRQIANTALYSTASP